MSTTFAIRDRASAVAMLTELGVDPAIKPTICVVETLK
jgi:hypothetical protein